MDFSEYTNAELNQAIDGLHAEERKLVNMDRSIMSPAEKDARDERLIEIAWLLVDAVNEIKARS